MRTETPSRSSRIALAGCIALTGVLLVAPARAERPHLSAGFGYGAVGLFHREYVEQAPHSSAMGEFSAGTYSAELGYLLTTHVMLGLRAHWLRVPLDKGSAVGELDVLPATVFAAYRHAPETSRVSGFVGLGVGRASVRFNAAESIDAWEPWKAETIDVSDPDPYVMELFAGVDTRLAEDFSLELALAATLMESEVAYRPRPIGGEDGLAAGHAYRVESRHVALTLGLRWWVEWW